MKFLPTFHPFSRIEQSLQDPNRMQMIGWEDTSGLFDAGRSLEDLADELASVLFEFDLKAEC